MTETPKKHRTSRDNASKDLHVLRAEKRISTSEDMARIPAATKLKCPDGEVEIPMDLLQVKE